MDKQHENLIAGFALAQNALLVAALPVLVKKGALTQQEAREIVDSALLGIETQTANMPKDFQEAGEMARKTLASILDLI